MSQLFTTGRVITDPELKTSANRNLYIHFMLRERIGYGETARNQTISVWAWGHMAEQLKRLGVKNGSLIWVSGSLELEDFLRKDGKTRDKQLKLKLNNWGYVPKDGERPRRHEKVPKLNDTRIEVIDGDRDPLPE